MPFKALCKLHVLRGFLAGEGQLEEHPLAYKSIYHLLPIVPATAQCLYNLLIDTMIFLVYFYIILHNFQLVMEFIPLSQNLTMLRHVHSYPVPEATLVRRCNASSSRNDYAPALLHRV